MWIKHKLMKFCQCAPNPVEDCWVHEIKRIEWSVYSSIFVGSINNSIQKKPFTITLEKWKLSYKNISLFLQTAIWRIILPLWRFTQPSFILFRQMFKNTKHMMPIAFEMLCLMLKPISTQVIFDKNRPINVKRL